MIAGRMVNRIEMCVADATSAIAAQPTCMPLNASTVVRTRTIQPRTISHRLPWILKRRAHGGGSDPRFRRDSTTPMMPIEITKAAYPPTTPSIAMNAFPVTSNTTAMTTTTMAMETASRNSSR